jgi:predicted ATP-dependent serine protease
MSDPTMAGADAPEIPILLLGDPGVGKSTFLSYVLFLITHPLHFLLLTNP